MHRSVLVGLAAVTLVANYASAADLPRKAPPPPVIVAPVSTWTGCYIGGNVGWARVSTEVTFNGFAEFDRSADGFAAGGQVGCDYQFASNWVIGVQFMADWTDIEASRTSVLFPANTLHAKLRGFGTLTGRLGYAVTPSFLFYGKFGWGAYSTNFSVENAAGVELASANRRQNGFDVGVGGEWMIAPNWSLWIEWDHIFAQDKTFFFPNLGPVGTTAEVRRDLDKVLVGFNWRFGGVGAAPVAARY
jgi:outer membrane immunogenic protein